MGSSKKVTVSYWYKLIAHLGWCKGPIDALLEIRGGDRTAWSGRQSTSGIINVNKPDLYGGESSEGGIQGQFEVMMGEPDQMPNSYLASEFGEAQSGYRGRATVVLRGPKIGAGNPYPKPLYFKLERIFKGWDNGVVWYPDKAAVPLQDGLVQMLGPGWEYQVENFSEPNTVWNDFSIPTSGWLQGGELPFATGSAEWPAMRSNIWIRRKVSINAVGVELRLAADNGCVLFIDGVQAGVSNPDNIPISNNSQYPVTYQFGAKGIVEVVGKAYAEINAGDDAGNNVDVSFVSLGGSYAMNPAHILYDSITSRRENGGMEEPVGRINDASFRAAADKLYAEGFGLCTSWKGGESAEQFQQRILNVIGGSLSQSRKDGMYYLDLLRGDYDRESLPTLTDDDILDWSAEPALPSESVNQIQVKWFDPGTREERITTPVQALGAIDDSGGVLPDIREYYEIPSESLALRVAQRDLQSVATPLWRFDITTNRKPYDLRPGTYLRLLCPKRGFADVVIVLGDIDYGNFGGDEIKIVGIQDVFGMPESAFVDSQGSLNPPANANPVPITVQTALEVPYVELVATMPSGELDALSPETSYVMAAAARPANGNNFKLATRAVGEEYEIYGNGDWSPVAVIVEEDVLSEAEPQTDFTFTGGRKLDSVTIGSWALWGDEIVRVDELDAVAGTIKFGRGCADTVPHEHAAESVVMFLGDWYATDSRDYVEGETVNVKMMNRTSQAQADISTVPELSVEMVGRQSRPYPPGQFKINDEYYPSSAAGPIPLALSWVGRNRVTQADQLVETTAGEIAAPAGTTYTVRGYENNALMHTETGIAGNSTSWSPSQSATIRIELEAVNALGRSSYQFHSHEMDWVSSLPDDMMAASIISKLTHWWPLDEATGTRMRDVHGGREMWVNGAVTLNQASIHAAGGASIRIDATTEFLSSYGKPFWMRRQPHDVSIIAWCQPDTVTSTEARYIIADAIASDSSQAINMIDNFTIGASGAMSLFWEYGVGTNGGIGSTWQVDTSAQFLGSTRLTGLSSAAIYRNGVAPDGFVSYVDQPTGGDDFGNFLAIGNSINNAQNQVLGLLQDVALFKTALTTDEHAWLWNAGAGRSYWDVLELATSETSWDWTPAHRSGKVVWLVSDDEQRVVSSGLLNRLENRAGFMEAVFDGNAESGSGVSPAVYGSETLNGRPVFSGNATNRAQARLPNTKQAWSSVNGVLVATVVKLGASFLPGSFLWQTNESSSSASLWRMNINTGGVVSMGGRRLAANTFAEAVTTGDYSGQWAIVVGWMNHSALEIGVRINGGAEEVVNNAPGWTAGVTSGSNKQKDLILGRSVTTGEENRDYSMAELVVLNNAPTLADMEQLEGYLAWEWGLVSLLPSGHPYKSVRPVFSP